MRFAGFFLLFTLIFSTSWAWDAQEYCRELQSEQVFEGETSELERANVADLCSAVGYYDQSLLPDQRAISSGKFKEGRGVFYNYSEFIQGLTKSLGKVNKSEKCDPELESDGRVAYPTISVENTAAGTIPISVVSEEEANKIFSDFANDERFVFDVIENGCYARAHIFARELEERGIRAGKMFLEGDLTIPKEKLFDPEEESMWSYHTAPVIAVQTKNGVELRVLDPALFDKPVPVKTWTEKMLPERGQKEEAVAYMTDRFNMGPLRGEVLPSAKSNPSRRKWHQADIIKAKQELEELEKLRDIRAVYRRLFPGGR